MRCACAGLFHTNRIRSTRDQPGVLFVTSLFVFTVHVTQVRKILHLLTSLRKCELGVLHHGGGYYI